MIRRTRTTILRSLAALPFLLGAGAAAGGDGDAPATKDGRPHPLLDVLRDVQRAAHLAAWKRVRTIGMAEATFSAAARLDADQDGIGEHGTLKDLAAFLVSAQKGGEQQPAIDPALAQVNDDGEVVVAGYVFKVFLPGKDGLGLHETSAGRAPGVAADLAEKHCAVYAWPRTYGRTGRFTFLMQPGSDVLAADVPEFSGRGHGPEPEAPLGAAPGGAPRARGVVVKWREATSVRPEDLLPDPVPPHAGPWRSAARLAALAAAAGDDVEKALGGPIPGGRPEVRIATLDEVEAALRADLVPMFERMGMPEKDRAGTLGFAAASLVAKYDRRSHVVLVAPGTAEIMAALQSVPSLVEDDALRIVLVREMTHAHDFKTHPLGAALDAVTTRDEFTAWGAVVQGHAQFVAQRVAAERGMTPAFERVTSALSWTPKTDDPALDAMFRSFSLTVGSPYISGLRFFHEVERQAGADAVARALASPPKSPLHIEQPAAWLGGKAAAPAVASEVILDRFAKAAGPGWAAQRSPLPTTEIRAQAVTLKVADDEHALDAITEMTAMFAQKPPPSGTFAVLVMRTANDAGAAALERFERRMSEAKDRAGTTGPVRVASAGYVDGAGAAGKLPGFVASKRFESGKQSQSLVLHVVRLPRCVLEITLVGGVDIERAALDEALADVQKMLEDGEKASGGK